MFRGGIGDIREWYILAFSISRNAWDILKRIYMSHWMYDRVYLIHWLLIHHFREDTYSSFLQDICIYTYDAHFLGFFDTDSSDLWVLYVREQPSEMSGRAYIHISCSRYHSIVLDSDRMLSSLSCLTCEGRYSISLYLSLSKQRDNHLPQMMEYSYVFHADLSRYALWYPETRVYFFLYYQWFREFRWDGSEG